MCQEEPPSVKQDLGARFRRFCRIRPGRGMKKRKGAAAPLRRRRRFRPDYFFVGTGVFAYSIAKLA